MFTVANVLSAYAICNEGLYWTGDECVTASVCHDMQKYAYKAIGMCNSIALKSGANNVPSHMGDYEYYCQTGYYLALSYDGSECLQDPSASGSFYVAEDKKACVSHDYECNEYMGYYAYDDGT